MLYVPVPKSVGVSLLEKKLPGRTESLDGLHVTLFCFEEMTLSQYTTAIEIVSSISSTRAFPSPMKLMTMRTHYFEGDGSKIPVFARVLSPSLMGLRAAIAEAFVSYEIPFKNNFPEYKPHITLSYSKEECSYPFEPISWTVSDLRFKTRVSGFGDYNMEAKIPLL